MFGIGIEEFKYILWCGAAIAVFVVALKVIRLLNKKEKIEYKVCPECAETINLNAKICKHCRHQFN